MRLHFQHDVACAAMAIWACVSALMICSAAGAGVVINVQPSVGSVAGGTTLVITGTDLYSMATASTLSIMIAGEWPCAVNAYLSTPATVVCTTTAAGFAIQNGGVDVATSSGVAACAGNCTFSYATGLCV